jgi:D-amino peptidase
LRRGAAGRGERNLDQGFVRQRPQPDCIKAAQGSAPIRGWSGHPYLTLQELDKSFAAVALVGYHSRAGSGSSPLAHSFTGKVTTIKINDIYVSEFLMYAFTSAYVGVPLVFVSGDQGICDEVKQFNSRIQTVAVKQGIGNSTVNVHPEIAIARIREGMAHAVFEASRLEGSPLPAHFLVEVRYRAAFNAYHDAFDPGARQTDAMTLRFETDDYFEVLRFMSFTVWA